MTEPVLRRIAPPGRTTPATAASRRRLLAGGVTTGLATLARSARPQEPGGRPEAEQVAVEAGDLPIIVSAPHGGTLPIAGVPRRTGTGLPRGGAGFVTEIDEGTAELAAAVSAAIETRFGRRPYLVVSRVHRAFVDMNRPPRIAYEDDDARPAHDRYHASLADFCRGITRRFGAGVLLDIHGQGEKADVVFRGTDDGGTVRHASRVFGADAVVGPRSILGLCRAGGWHVHPDPLDGREAPGFTGGHIVRTYGTLPGTAIDAYQLEFGREFRRPERRHRTAATLAAALADYARRYLPGAGVEPDE